MQRSHDATAPLLRIKYDPEAGAMYWKLRDGEVAETLEVEPLVYIDIDHSGRPLGVEFVVADDLIPFLARHGGEFVIPAQMETLVTASPPLS
jgi:uncharacterized protein YuzE